MKTTALVQQLPQKYHGNNNSGNNSSSSSHHRRGSEEKSNKNGPPRNPQEDEEDNETVASCFSAGSSSTFSWSLCKGWSPRKTIKNVKPKLTTIEGNNNNKQRQQQSCINLLLDTTTPTASIISNELIELLDDDESIISNVSDDDDDDDEFLFHTEAEPSGPPTYVIASCEEKKSSASPRAPDNDVRGATDDKVATAPLWESSSFLKDATTKEEAAHATTTRTTKGSKHNATEGDNMAPYSRCPASASNGIMLIRSPSGRKCHLELDVLGLESSSSSSSLDDATTTTTTATTTKGEDQQVPSTPSSSSSCRQRRKRCSSVQGFLTPKVPHGGGSGNKQAKKLPLSTPRMPRKDNAPPGSNGKFVVDTQGPGRGLVVWVRAPGSPRAHLELDITTTSSPQEKKHMFVTAGSDRSGGNFKESSPCGPLRNATWAPMA